MAEQTLSEKREVDLAIQIFATSSVMIGVCLTFIGILGISKAYQGVEVIGDDITVVDAFIFLGACVFSYAALRTKKKKKRILYENIADVFFLIGLFGMALICAFLVYELI